MRVFYVWDALNGSPEEARQVRASTPQEAACQYADSDSDGWTDGLYQKTEQPLVVVSDEGLEQWCVEVQAEMIPRMQANRTQELTGQERHAFSPPWRQKMEGGDA